MTKPKKFTSVYCKLNRNQVVIKHSVTMATLKLHKSWQTFIYKTFITESNGGLSWEFHSLRNCHVVTSLQSNGHKAVHQRCVRVSLMLKRLGVVQMCTVLIIQQPDSRCAVSLQPISSVSTGDVTSSSMLVWAATNPLHSISLGHKFILQTNCSASVGSSMFLISLLFTLLIQHHLSWPSKLWKADRRPRRVLDRSAKSDSWLWFSLLGLSVSSL